MKKILTSLLPNYKDSDWILQHKAKILLLLNLAAVFVTAVELFISSFTIENIAPEFLPNITIIVILLASVVLLKQGKYELSSVLTIVTVTGGITWTRYLVTGQYSSDASYDFTQYVLDLIIVLFYTNLIAKSRYLFGFVFIIILTFLIFYAMVLPRFELVKMHPYSNSVFISGFAFIGLAGVIGWFTFRQTETAIKNVKKEEQKYYSLFENAQDAIFVLKDDRFIECNPRTLQLFDCNREEILGKTPVDFSPEYQSDGISSDQKARWLIDVAMSGIPQRFEWQHVRSDRGIFDADVSLNKMDLVGDTVLLAIVRDISEKKRHQKEVYMSYMMGEENERTRIAKDLHDGLGPLLSACKIYHHNLGLTSYKENDRSSYEKLGMMLTESMVGLKEISNNLSPHILRNFGLVEALKNFTENLKSELIFIFEGNCPSGKRYDEFIEVSLYRVLTELVHNSLKHSEATEIKIRIDEINGALNIIYRDNGKGFSFEESRKSGGSGLVNMQSRIHTLGGEIKFAQGKDNGISVSIAIIL